MNTQQRVAAQLQAWDTDLLIQLACDLDVAGIAIKQLAARGLDYDGEWIGFDEAEKLWNEKGEGK